MRVNSLVAFWDVVLNGKAYLISTESANDLGR